MSDMTQVMNDIEEAFKNIHKSPAISKKKILTYLFDLRAKEQYLSDSEFYHIVGEIYKSNPMDFINYLNTGLRSKMAKLYGVEKRREMDKHILENYCLSEGEQILYECNGSISQTLFGTTIYASGCMFITNHRIFAQGKLRGIKYTKKLCYGFIFRYKDSHDLEIRANTLTYKLEEINFLHKLYDILNKNRLIENEVLEVSDHGELSPSTSPYRPAQSELKKRDVVIALGIWSNLFFCIKVLIIPIIVIILLIIILI